MRPPLIPTSAPVILRSVFGPRRIFQAWATPKQKVAIADVRTVRHFACGGETAALPYTRFDCRSPSHVHRMEPCYGGLQCAHA